jgi:hypothetical protein
MTLIQLYRGNGRHTSWMDSWINNKPLSIQFLAPFSHVLHPNMTVAESFTEHGCHLRFHHITSHEAENELTALLDLITNITLKEEADSRSMRFGPHKKFSVKSCYELWWGYGIRELRYLDLLAPKKCKIFTWLALHDRLNT